ncbi:AAA domain-containing protein [Aquabacterium commune]|uniref:AAA domain-containing protein n=1 Tax=Aquabacterium commune TaxID=70586 RepID=A0A4V3CV77_9BURK|nr:ATP-binding protein [Aquabacterium commune]TDP81388.1 AAA domain-containing protein [Aquabacterium commune]
MFHLQSLELLHWDYCQRLTLPLDGAIITVAGPNGSGKTTLLDAMRTLLGLECSGGRSYKTYARHANADCAWLRATVDNRPRNRQSSNRPFARCLLYADVVTLACRIDRNGGDWTRRYTMVEGDVSIEQLIERSGTGSAGGPSVTSDKDWLGIDNWRKRLEGAGLSRAIAKVLALEQGQTDRLCEYSPKELLKLVFDVFGDQDVLDRYDEARSHQRQLTQEVEAAERELSHGRAQRAELEVRVNNHRQYELKCQERERLATEVVPVMANHETRKQLATKLRELHRQRLQSSDDRRAHGQVKAELLQRLHEQTAAAEHVESLEAKVRTARRLQEEARDAERPMELTVKRADELQGLAVVEGDAAQLTTRIAELSEHKQKLSAQWQRLKDQRDDAQKAFSALQGQRQAPPPPDVTRFRRVLDEAGIHHHLIADVIEIADERWRAAAEGVLRGSRWVVVLAQPGQEAQAMALAERERYRHYIVADADHAPASLTGTDKHSLLAVLKFSAPVPRWLLRQLSHIQRVDSTEAGVKAGGEWITPEAYHRDGRGGRSVWVDPGQHQFGASAVATRRASIENRLAQLDEEMTRIVRDQAFFERQLQDARQAAQGFTAAAELIEREAEFNEARRQLPVLKQARVDAGERWQQAEADLKRAVVAQTHAQHAYRQAQERLAHIEQRSAQHEREWQARFDDLMGQAVMSREVKLSLPAAWRRAERLRDMQTHYGNATQARLRAEAVDRELSEGQWETDGTVAEQLTLMNANVLRQEDELGQRKASNAAAAIAVDNARDRYTDVLKVTVRRYRKNIIELGQLAGVDVQCELPHLGQDDVSLRQAELKVHFNFDGKGHIGLNDGEASGGQQVIKSLILLVGLMKDDETPGGFVFIDEPFAHLDVRNIQLVGHFLRSTRAQYVLTTPITHNVEVFEPADVTLVTAKKAKGARWAPPIGVLQRRPPADVV